MKLTYDPQTDRRELRKLISLLIAQHKGHVVSGMQLRQHTAAEYGISIDHHEFAYELDAMSRRGECKHHDYHGGDTQYIVN